ncbi:hypothetical protein ACOCJ7_12475 [Knoellia sp. CPCC 206453]|uniref:hypothetical protein n=1 Tax=Knoellia pratensis TaxID=3404796 RepID=UPI003608B9ED
MGTLRKIRRTAVGIGLASLLTTPVVLGAGMGPAAAVDGGVSSHYTAMGGGGSTAQAYVNWSSSTKVVWQDIYVNDTCPGDGHVAILKFVVRYEGDSGWTTVGTRRDEGTCESAPYTESSASWSSSRRINDATVVACVESVGCAAAGSDYRDNPYW